MTKTYLHAGVAHTDTSTEYMAALGMDEQTQAAVLAQLEFEESMDVAAAKKARDAAVAKVLLPPVSGLKRNVVALKFPYARFSFG